MTLPSNFAMFPYRNFPATFQTLRTLEDHIKLRNPLQNKNYIFQLCRLSSVHIVSSLLFDLFILSYSGCNLYNLYDHYYNVHMSTANAKSQACIAAPQNSEQEQTKVMGTIPTKPTSEGPQKSGSEVTQNNSISIDKNASKLEATTSTKGKKKKGKKTEKALDKNEGVHKGQKQNLTDKPVPSKEQRARGMLMMLICFNSVCFISGSRACEICCNME